MGLFGGFRGVFLFVFFGDGGSGFSLGFFVLLLWVLVFFWFGLVF